jgi:hypothetical protein
MIEADPSAVVTLLLETPARIAAAARGRGAEVLHWQPAPDSWSVNEVIAHLRSCADVWGGYIAKILEQDNPKIRYVSPRTWIRKTNYMDLDFAASFAAFRKQRDELLKTLRSLSREQWSRRATVKASAQTREETVLSYAVRLAVHEAGHCDQIERILHARGLVK